MQYRDLKQYFPELADLPESEREWVVEQARYDTFTGQNASTRWVLGSALAVAVGVLLAVLLFVLAYFALGTAPVWLGSILAGIGIFLFSLVQRRRYAMFLRPSVQRLCRARST